MKKTKGLTLLSMNDPVSTFWRLHDQFRENYRLLYYNAPEQEAVLVQLLKYARTHPEVKSDLEKCFIEIVDNADENGKCRDTWWIVLFCMRELRWTEVKAAIEKKLALGMVCDSVWRHMLSAYSEKWGFEGHFKYFEVHT